MRNTKLIGDKSLAKVLAALIDREVPVSLPWGDNQRYDLVMDAGGLLRVQVKTARIRAGALLFSTGSISPGSRRRRDYAGQIDYFAAYSPTYDQVYLVPAALAKKNTMQLRIAPPRNGQVRKTTRAAAYVLDVELAKLGFQSAGGGSLTIRP